MHKYKHTGRRHTARHTNTRLCTNLHHYPGRLSLASHQTKTRQDKTQTRVDSAVRHTDTTQKITSLNQHIFHVVRGTKYTQKTHPTHDGKFVEQSCAKRCLVSTAIEGGKHDEIGDCNMLILSKKEC